MREDAGRIRVQVRSFATLREVMEPDTTVTLTVPATIRSLLTLLIGKYPGLGDRLFSGPETFHEYVNILRNGRNIHFLAGPDTPLDDGDTVALFPPAAGG